MALIKKFRFSLSPVLRLRRLQEKQALGELAKVLVEHNTHQLRIQNAKLQLNGGSDDKDDINDKMDNSYIEKYQMRSRYGKRLEGEIFEAEKKMEALRPQLEEEQAKVRVVRRKKRVMELLEEKEKAEHKRKMQKIERKELLEINQTRKKSVFLWNNISGVI